MANIHDIQAAAQALADAEATLHRTIAEAVDGGVSITKAAAAAGVTRTTAYRWIADITKDEPGED